VELEDERIDLEDLDSAYEEDLDQQEFRNDSEQPNEQPSAPAA
jgi:hypothetical protein